MTRFPTAAKVTTWVATVILATQLASAAPSDPAPAASRPTVPAPVAAATMPVGPEIGRGAPIITATTLDGKPVSLSDYRGKPIVLQFASITDPFFRMRVPGTEKLAKKLGDQAVFLIIYRTEAHPADTHDALSINAEDGVDVPAPANQTERIKLAKEAVDRLGIRNQTMLVDSWDNTTSRRYRDLPNETVLIDRSQKIVGLYAFMDPQTVGRALDELLSGHEVSLENQGVQRGPLAPAIMPDGTGRSGVTSAVSVFDGLSLTDSQKSALLAPLANYMGDLRTLRDVYQKKDAATAKERDDAINEAQTAADRLRAALKQELSHDDYEQMIEALDRGIGHRFFTNETKPATAPR